jgi:hypothetical protein
MQRTGVQHRFDGCDELLGVARRAEFDTDEPGLPAVGADRLDGLLPGGSIRSVMDDDLGAVVGHPQCDRTADPPARSSHQGRLSGEVSHPRHPFH